MDIADIIRGARAQKGWSQRKLASAIGVKPSAVAQWETGGTKPSILNRADIARLLDVPFEKLLPELPDIGDASLGNPRIAAIIRTVLQLPEPLQEAFLMQAVATLDHLRVNPPKPKG